MNKQVKEASNAIASRKRGSYGRFYVTVPTTAYIQRSYSIRRNIMNISISDKDGNIICGLSFSPHTILRSATQQHTAEITEELMK